jgi:hypothetical protein
MTALDSFHPARNASNSSAPITSCSAHYFELSGSTLAAAWYGEGLRVIDASNARNLRQVGYYYVTGTDTTAKLATVREPKRGPDRLAKVPVSGLTPGSLVCPLFVRQ